MRQIKKLTVLFLMLALLVSAMGLSVFAEDYTYTVKVSTGTLGSAGGSTEIVTKDLKLVDTYSFNLGSISVNDDRYYVKGLAEAGSQNVIGNGFTVDGDRDLVVVYGMKGDNITSYTVEYRDAANNSLIDSETFYGAAGEKPVVTGKYIAGYVPSNAYSITGTIAADGTTVFPFLYAKGTANTVTVTKTQTTTIATTINVASASTGSTGSAGTAGSTADGTAAEGTKADNVEASEAEETPAEVIDIDEQTVPQAQSSDTDTDSKEGTEKGTEDGSEKAEKSGLGGGAIAAIIAAVLAVLAALGVVVKKKSGN